MKNTKKLKAAIAELLASEKAYNLPKVCKDFNLDDGEEAEAFLSKRKYVANRLAEKTDSFVLELALKIHKKYELTYFSKIIEPYFPEGIFEISSITRRLMLDEFLLKEQYISDEELIPFLESIWDLEDMPSTDDRFTDVRSDICQHMINNYDWDMNYLYEDILDVMYISDNMYITLLEQLAYPKYYDKNKQECFIEKINSIIKVDGFQLRESGQVSGYPFFKVYSSRQGVSGRLKNLIFSADGPKPEIVFSDSINNDIKIVKNEKYCLVYDKAIPKEGLAWNDLVSWWSDLKSYKCNEDPEKELYKRLYKSLDSVPEKLFFKTYFSKFRGSYLKNLPALIPQVYLHYDPYTLKSLGGRKCIPRQRMDFLFLFSNKDRVVIEIDGKQHYSNGDISSPKLYSEMVSADRDLKLRGYDIYRFGGFELTTTGSENLIENFINALFELYKIK